MAMIHPFSFMFIKSFEDVRKLIISKTHIELLVDFGLDRVNLFDGGYASAPTFYILSKQTKDSNSIFFKLIDGYQEKDKKSIFENAFNNFINGRNHPIIYILKQKSFERIKSLPFIYWISDDFRNKFEGLNIEEAGNKAITGIQTGNNEAALRYFWEVSYNNIKTNNWITYSKGGKFNKWYGNLQLMVNWAEEGNYLRSRFNFKSIPQDKIFKEGITYSALGGGVSFRYLPQGTLFDIGGSSIIPLIYDNYVLGLTNSKLFSYILKCLNPTVNTQVGDINRLPFAIPSENQKSIVSILTSENIELKKKLNSYFITENNFLKSPLIIFQSTSLVESIQNYLSVENLQHTQIIINEAIINEIIFEVYQLSVSDREQVELKMGVSIGSLPILTSAKEHFLSQLINPLDRVKEFIENIPECDFEEQKVREIKDGFSTLFQTNNDLEQYCIQHQVNPVNVWFWFNEEKIVPVNRAEEIALEFIADTIRMLLQQDDDGIIPLVGLPGEESLSQRLEQHCLQNGFTSAQYIQLDSLLGRPLNEYLDHHFFNHLSNHLNLFMYLPKTPFIWHLTSGEYQGFDAYISIYKWNRDSLFKLKSQYISSRTQNLEYRQIQLLDVNTAQSQAEKEKIRLQLIEIEKFKQKIDELIAEGYDPKLDDGVGKNIAPLQKKGLLRAEVLKSTQLTKYLNADW
jgi:hypothetical protein